MTAKTVAFVAVLVAVMITLLILTPNKPAAAEPEFEWSEIPVCLDCGTAPA